MEEIKVPGSWGTEEETGAVPAEGTPAHRLVISVALGAPQQPRPCRLPVLLDRASE